MDISNHFKLIKVQYPLIHFKMNGFWDDAVATKIEFKFLQEWKEAVDRMMGKPFIAIADLETFKPNTEKVHTLMGECMKYANEKGLFKTIEVIPQAIQRLGVKSAEQKSGKNNFRIVVDSMIEAQKQFNILKTQIG